MRIQTIYEQYHIPPRLQLHMLRVARIAQIVCAHATIPLDTTAIISASLLHDMGNVCKFDFTKPLYANEHVAYRKAKQAEFIHTYGTDEHHATYTITTEITTNAHIRSLVSATGYTSLTTHFDTFGPAEKICCYADLRVMPNGVGTLQKRMEEAHQRYAGVYRATPTHFHEALPVILRLEREVMATCTCTPEEIHESTVEPFLDTLRSYEIPA